MTTAANAVRREAERAAGTNPVLERLLLDQAERLDAVGPAMDRLWELDRAIATAVLVASRTGEADIHEALSEIAQAVVDRRRRAARGRA